MTLLPKGSVVGIVCSGWVTRKPKAEGGRAKDRQRFGMPTTQSERSISDHSSPETRPYTLTGSMWNGAESGDCSGYPKLDARARDYSDGSSHIL